MDCSAGCGDPYIPERRFESIPIVHDPYNSECQKLEAPSGQRPVPTAKNAANGAGGMKDVDVMALLLLALALILVFNYKY